LGFVVSSEWSLRTVVRRPGGLAAAFDHHGDRRPEVSVRARSAADAVNFQLTLIIATIGTLAVTAILLNVLDDWIDGMSLIGLAVTPIFVLIIGWIAAMISMVKAGISASRGSLYHYPFNIRIVR
jgi:uncharacterized Tic20 family protein